MGELLEIGKIVNTHGLRGEVKVTPWCDDISVFEQVDAVTVEGKRYAVVSVQPHKHSYLVKLKGVDRIEQAEILKNKVMMADRHSLQPLPENTYYVSDLLGMDVYDEQGPIGIIADWFPTGSNDVYVVRREGKSDLLLPAIRQVIRKVDVAARRMDVTLLEGLADED